MWVFLECLCSIVIPPPPPSLFSTLLHMPFYLATFYYVHAISSCSNHPERYSMNNSGLVPSSSPLRQTPETIFYDTPITKKQHVSTKYDSSGNQPLCHCHSLSHQVWSGWVTMVLVCGGVPTPENLGNLDALRLLLRQFLDQNGSLRADVCNIPAFLLLRHAALVSASL